MNTEEELVINIWDMFKDNVPAKQKTDRAYSLLKYFVDAEIITDVSSLEGEDDNIDEAIALFDDEDGEDYY